MKIMNKIYITYLHKIYYKKNYETYLQYCENLKGLTLL